MKKWLIHHPYLISSSDVHVLQCAYALFTTPQTIQTYLTCCAFSSVREGVFTTHDLAKHLNVFDHEVENLIQSCVSIGLLEWYEQPHVITLVIKQPLTVIELTHHSVFGRLLSTQDSLYLNALKIKYPPLRQDIKPTQFKYAQQSVLWDDEREEKYQQSQLNVEADPSFFKTNLFLQLCEDIIFPSVLRTVENTKFIAQLGNAYLVDELSMRKYVHESMDYDLVKIDLDKLAHIIKSKHHVAGYSDLSYNQHHLSFFSALNKGRAVIQKDQQLIEYLKEHYTFDQETFNYFLEVVLTSSKGRFTRRYAEQIGESWLRANIKHLEDAKRYVQTQQAPSTLKNVAPLPEYYTHVEEDDDKKALLKQLKEMEHEGN